METLTIIIPPEAKNYIQANAALKGMTLENYVLECTGYKNKEREYTSDDFNAETIAALNEDLSNAKEYDLEEALTEMKSW